MGREREDFERHHEAAGLEGPPRGKLEEYATDVLAQIPRLLASGDDDDERSHALRAMESVARGLLRWIEDTPAHPSRASRAARGTPAQATTPAPAPGASTRTATVRDRYRRRAR